VAGQRNPIADRAAERGAVAQAQLWQVAFEFRPAAGIAEFLLTLSTRLAEENCDAQSPWFGTTVDATATTLARSINALW